MATYTWRGFSGAFGDGQNWDLGSAPGSADTALLAANGGTISGSGAVGFVSFSAFAWSVVGQIQADGGAVGGNGSLLMAAGGQLVVNGALSVASASVAVASNSLLQVNGGNASGFTGGTLGVSAGGRAVLTGGLALASTTATIDGGLLTVGGGFQLGTAAGGAGSLVVQNAGLVAFTAPLDFYNVTVQFGAAAGSNVAATVSGANSQLIATSDSSAIGAAGSASLLVSAGGAARFTSPYNAASPAQRAPVGGTTGTIALTVGLFNNAVGAVTVSGAGSVLASNGSLLVGGGGRGTLSVGGGARATSSSVGGVQAALAVAAGAGGSGSVSIDGAGSLLAASGAAVVGGDNRGAGLSGGGAGTVTVTGGGALQTGAMTILAGSSVAVDGASSASIAGDLFDGGGFSAAGSLSVSGTVSGGSTLTVGSVATLGGLASTAVALSGSATLLRVGALSGTSTVSGLVAGNAIDLLGQQATLSGNTVSAGGGALALGAAPAGLQYTLSSDGAGGTLVSLGVDTIGVFRFFDSTYGTHFFSSSANEKSAVIATRPDLVYEGIGLRAIDPASPDPHAAAVYRFFDSTYGTHFFTASATERDGVIANRPDLKYEGVGFVEHTTQQAGDVPVYRFFDSRFGTHFYTADGNEKASIAASRPDLVYEGIGFYAPS